MGDTKSLVQGMFVSKERERTWAVAAFRDRVSELLGSSGLDELRELLKELGDAARASNDAEARGQAVAALAEVVSVHYPGIVEWLARPQRRRLAAALLESLGRKHVERMLHTLVDVGPESAAGLWGVIRALETPRELVERLARLDATEVRRFLAGIADLPDPEVAPVLRVALVSPSRELRLAMLRHLSEARAYRFLPVVRQRLHDPDPRVRSVALRWVQRLEDAFAVPELERLLARESIVSPEREAIQRVLAPLKPRALLLKAG